MSSFNIVQIDAEPRIFIPIYVLGVTEILWNNGYEDLIEQSERDNEGGKYELPAYEFSVDLEKSDEIDSMIADLNRRHSSRTTMSSVPESRYTLEILLESNLKSKDVYVTLQNNELAIYLKFRCLNTQGIIENAQELLKKVTIPQNVITERITCILKPGGVFIIDAPMTDHMIH